MEILLGQTVPHAGFDITRLADYGVLGMMLLAVMYSLKSVQIALVKSLEDRTADANANLGIERKARQEFEARVTVILDQIVKTTEGLVAQVGQKREAIDQLAGIIGELVQLIHSLKREVK
jgi:hypothetical protein